MQDDLTKILAANLTELMNHAKERRDFRVASVKQLALTSGVGRPTIDAALGKRSDDAKKPRALRVDTLQALATALGVPAWMLLTPSLNPHDRPWLMTHRTVRRATGSAGGIPIDASRLRNGSRATGGGDHRNHTAKQSGEKRTAQAKRTAKSSR